MAAIPWDKVNPGYEASPGSRCWCGGVAVHRCHGCGAEHCQRHRYTHSHTSASMQETERLLKEEHAQFRARQATR